MNDGLKIAMVAACPFPCPRGTPIRIFRMAEALSRRGHEVHVVTYHLGDEVKELPFHIHRIPAVKTYRRYSPGPTYQKLLVLDPLLAFELFRVLKTQPFDLIHAHHYEGLLVSRGVRRWSKLPIVYDAHTLLESELPYYPLGLPKRIKHGIGRRIDHWLPRDADHIISVTDSIRTKLIREAGVTPKDITVVSNGVENRHFARHSGKDNGRKTEEKTLIFAGNLAPYQGINFLLNAFKRVLNVRKDTRLQIVSDSPFDNYESLAKTLGIRDHVDVIKSDFHTLPEILARADIALNPRTDCDGIPMKLLNYMAAGKPTVSFAGSAKPLIHGESGLIVENGNVAAFADAIHLLLNDSTLAGSLGENARVYASSELSWEEKAQQIEIVYEMVLSHTKKL